MKKIPGWAWPIIRIIVIAFILWQAFSYLLASHEENTQPGWPVNNVPADSNEKR